MQAVPRASPGTRYSPHAPLRPCLVARFAASSIFAFLDLQPPRGDPCSVHYFPWLQTIGRPTQASKRTPPVLILPPPPPPDSRKGRRIEGGRERRERKIKIDVRAPGTLVCLAQSRGAQGALRLVLPLWVIEGLKRWAMAIPGSRKRPTDNGELLRVFILFRVIPGLL